MCSSDLQLGLLKSTMLQLDSTFNERAYGANSFSDFVDKLKRADLVQVSGHGGRYVIEPKHSGGAATKPNMRPEDLLTPLRDVLENHRLELENGAPVDDLAAWFKEEQSHLDISGYGFQQFSEFMNYAQDKTVVRMEPMEEEGGMQVSLGAEFYPPAEPPAPEPVIAEDVEEEDEPQPYVEGQPTIFEPNPPPPKAKKAPARKRAPKAAGSGAAGGAQRRSRRKKPTGGNS